MKEGKNWHSFEQREAVDEASQVVEIARYELGGSILEAVTIDPMVACLMFLIIEKNPELRSSLCEGLRASLFLRGAAPFTEGVRK